MRKSCTLQMARGARKLHLTMAFGLKQKNEQIESTSMSWEVSMWASLGFSFADLLRELQDLSE